MRASRLTPVADSESRPDSERGRIGCRAAASPNWLNLPPAAMAAASHRHAGRSRDRRGFLASDAPPHNSTRLPATRLASGTMGKSAFAGMPLPELTGNIGAGIAQQRAPLLILQPQHTGPWVETRIRRCGLLNIPSCRGARLGRRQLHLALGQLGFQRLQRYSLGLGHLAVDEDKPGETDKAVEQETARGPSPALSSGKV